MKKITYLAVFEPNASGGFGVYFPDLPGCISIGDDFEQASRMAEEALGLHLWSMERDDDDIPAPTQPPFDDMPEGAVVVAITIFPELVKHEMETRSVRANVTIPFWLKALAEKEGVNISQTLQAALKERLRV